MINMTKCDNRKIRGFMLQKFLIVLSLLLLCSTPSVLAQGDGFTAQSPLDFGGGFEGIEGLDPPLSFGGDQDLGGMDFGGPSGADIAVSASGRFTQPDENGESILFVVAEVEEDWHIYSTTQAPGGPVTTKIMLDESSDYELLGDFQAATEPHKDSDTSFGPDLVVETHEGEAVWYAPIKINPSADIATLSISGSVFAQPCIDEACFPPTPYNFGAELGEALPIPETENETHPEEGTVDETETSSVGSWRDFELDEQEKDAKPLLEILVLAFLGGLILNFMPCVLPVLGLKIMSFFHQAGENRTKAFLLNLWYSIGVISVFLILAGTGIGLGGMFASQTFTIGLCIVVFAMSLSLMDVWEIRLPSFLSGQKASSLMAKEGPAGAVFKGALTTILGASCSGPLIAPAFVWIGIQAKAGNHAGVYLAAGTAGLGMSFPYLLIGAYPELIRFLPKPGEWMETFKKSMGFLLLTAVLWMLYMLPVDLMLPTVAILFAIWFACWVIGRLPLTSTSNQRLAAWAYAVVVCCLVFYAMFYWIVPDLLEKKVLSRATQLQKEALQEQVDPSEAVASVDAEIEHLEHWAPFNGDTFDQILAEHDVVVVDFTATWCMTCITIEKTVLESREVLDYVDKNNVATIQADVSDTSGEEMQFLDALGGLPVPVIAVFSRADPGNPKIFRGTLLTQQLLDAMEKAGGK
jgi:suppressor for copper-sensitivity B